MPPRVGNPLHRRRHFIAEWRDFRGLTQQQLADAINSTKATISRVEGLKQGYTQDLLEAVADALGVHPGTLLTRGPNETDRAPARPSLAHRNVRRPQPDTRKDN
jgi:transcriptional regulator with XRE-family HTH domain